MIEINNSSGRVYLITQDEHTDYLNLRAHLIFVELYNYPFGDPRLDKVTEMDDCIHNNWDPSRFQELFNDVHEETEWSCVII